MSTRRARRLGLTFLAVTLLASLLGPAGAEAKSDTQLIGQMILALRAAKFGETIDFGSFEDVCPGASFCPVPAGRVKYVPNVDWR